jgi:hypothetical protein
MKPEEIRESKNTGFNQFYTLLHCGKFYEPSGLNHVSFWYSGGTEQELAWKE